MSADIAMAYAKHTLDHRVVRVRNGMVEQQHNGRVWRIVGSVEHLHKQAMNEAVAQLSRANPLCWRAR